MVLALSPEIERLIDEQVKSGRFPTAEAVVEAAVANMRNWNDELGDEDLAAIRESDEQAERGEVIDLADVKAYFAKKG